MKARVAFCSLLLLATAAQAGIYYVKADATGDGRGTSWANAMTSLSIALATVPAGTGDEVWVAAGTYRPSTDGLADPREATFAVPSKAGLYGGFAGTETARSQRNPKVHATILSGDLLANDVATGEWNDASHADNARHVVTLTNSCSCTSLDGFIITAGYDERTHWYECHVPAGDCSFLQADGQGAGVLITGGGPKINDCIFQDNNVRGYGGGLYASASTASVTNCTFYDNTAWTETNGGGGGAAIFQSASTLTNCVFVRNNTRHSGGGFMGYDSTVNLLNCTVFGNTGGGVFVGGSTATITNCIVYGNPDFEEQIRYSAYDLEPPMVAYSCVEGGWSEAGTVGNIDADPLFVDTAAGDLHLQADSPCIDTGNSDAPGLPGSDRDGNARTTGARVDMGAYEYHVPAAPPPSNNDDLPLVMRLCGAGFPMAILGSFAGLVVMRRRSH